MTIHELSKIMPIDSVAFHCPQGDLVLGIGSRHCYDDMEVDHIATIPYEGVETRVVLGQTHEVKVLKVEVRATIKGEWTENTIPSEEE